MNIFKLIKLLFSSKQYVIYVINKKDEIIKKESSNITEDFQHHIFNDSRVSLINTVTEEKYGESLEQYEPDLFNAYKEADYQIAKSEYLQAELDYYKLVNNPTSGDANVLYTNYRRLQQLKDKYENFQ